MSYITKSFDAKVIELLKNGGVGFMPSDTIYGLSCQAMNQAAVERIYRLKQRDSDKPLILIIANISQLEQLGIEESQTEPAKKYWPGSLTLICLAPQSPAYLHRGTSSLAVRLPDDKQLCALMKQVGPIVSTSANVQGGEVITSAQEAQEYFGDQLDFYVDIGDLSDRQPSTLVKAVNGGLEVVRQGSVKL